MMKRLLIFAAALGFLTGCSVDASLTNLAGGSSPITPPRLFDKAGGSEFVSGSFPGQLSVVRQYKVDATVGHFLGQPVQKTAHGYTVYSSVQGSLISDQ